MSENTLALIKKSNEAIQSALFGGAPPTSSAPSGGGATEGATSVASMTPAQQSAARAVQSVGQTTAIVIQDAGDMLRNISTIETTAIGVATAAWIAAVAANNTTAAAGYQAIIQEGTTVMTSAAVLYGTIGTEAYKVLAQFNS
jgi:hypothetical protein